MTENIIMERAGASVTADGMTATIPSDVSMLAIFARNPFISSGKYEDDGWVYVDGKPVKKWFKNVEDVSIWFPILEDVRKLQKRYFTVNVRYKKYLNRVFLPAHRRVMEAGKAHALVTHKHEGGEPYWLYRADKYPGQEGVSWDWVKTPDKPINLNIGNAYYKAEQRLSQIGGRSYKFRKVLEYAIEQQINKIKGTDGQILKFVVDNKIYWYQWGRYSWVKLAFPEDDIKAVVWEEETDD